MRKTLSRLFVVALFAIFALSLVSCTKPELDFDDAEDNLEDADYTVYVSEKSSVNVEKELRATHKDGDYLLIAEYKDAKSAKIAYQEYKLSRQSQLDELKAEIKYYELRIKEYKNLIDKYDDDIDADTYEERIEELEDGIEELEDDIKKVKEMSLGRSGKIVWYGTKDAVKDSK